MAVELDSVRGYSLIVNLVKRETKKKTKGHMDDSGDDACLGQKAKNFRQQPMTWSLGMEMLNAPNKRRIWNSGCRNCELSDWRVEKSVEGRFTGSQLKGGSHITDCMECFARCIGCESSVFESCQKCHGRPV